MNKTYTRYFITQTYSNSSDTIHTSPYKEKLSDLLFYFPSDKDTGIFTLNKVEITTYTHLEPCIYSAQLSLDGAFKIIEQEIASLKSRMGVSKPVSNDTDKTKEDYLNDAEKVEIADNGSFKI